MNSDIKARPNPDPGYNTPGSWAPLSPDLQAQCLSRFVGDQKPDNLCMSLSILCPSKHVYIERKMGKVELRLAPGRQARRREGVSPI